MDRLAAELPESQWSVLPPADQLQEQYARVKHQPGECQSAHTFATVPWKNDGDLMWRFGIELRRMPTNPQSKRDAPYPLSAPHGEQHGSTLVVPW